jgi:hypothetical protein
MKIGFACLLFILILPSLLFAQSFIEKPDTEQEQELEETASLSIDILNSGLSFEQMAQEIERVLEADYKIQSEDIRVLDKLVEIAEGNAEIETLNRIKLILFIAEEKFSLQNVKVKYYDTQARLLSASKKEKRQKIKRGVFGTLAVSSIVVGVGSLGTGVAFDYLADKYYKEYITAGNGFTASEKLRLSKQYDFYSLLSSGAVAASALLFTITFPLW